MPRHPTDRTRPSDVADPRPAQVKQPIPGSDTGIDGDEDPTRGERGAVGTTASRHLRTAQAPGFPAALVRHDRVPDRRRHLHRHAGLAGLRAVRRPDRALARRPGDDGPQRLVPADRGRGERPVRSTTGPHRGRPHPRPRGGRDGPALAHRTLSSSGTSWCSPPSTAEGPRSSARRSTRSCPTSSPPTCSSRPTRWTSSSVPPRGGSRVPRSGASWSRGAPAARSWSTPRRSGSRSSRCCS